MGHSFADPVHNAKVNLTKLQRHVFCVLEPEMDRLRGIRNLGIISHVLPAAQHTKLEHQVGVIYLVGRAAYAKKLPDSFAEAFELAAATYHIGHLPFTYSSERALLLAAAESPELADRIAHLVKPLDDVPRKCEKCTSTACGRPDVPPSALVKDLIDQQRWRRLYRIFTAKKVFGKPDVRTTAGEWEAELLHILITPHCKWHRLVARLDRLDYTLRDLNYATPVHFHCNTGELIADEHAPEWSLLDDIEHGYLENHVYNAPQVRLRRALLEKALAKRFLAAPSLLQELLDATSDLATDEGLRADCVGRKAFAGVFDPAPPSFQKYWELDIEDPARSPARLEQHLTGYDKSLFDYPQRTGTLVVPPVEWEPPEAPPARSGLLLSVASFDNPRDRELKAFARHMRRISEQYPAYDSHESIHRPLFEFLLGCEVRLFAHDPFSVLADFIIEADVADALWKLASQRRAAVAAQGYDRGVSFDIRLDEGDPSHPLVPLSQSTFMHAFAQAMLRSDRDEPRREAARFLAEDVIGNAHAFCCPPDPSMREQLETVADSIRNALLGACGGDPRRGRLLEVYALLHILRERTRKWPYRWIVANLICQDADDLSDEHEYDIVELSLSGNSQVALRAWGCTAARDVHAKRSEDMAKLAALEERVRSRFPQVHPTLHNYFFLEGRNIWHDPEGGSRACV